MVPAVQDAVTVAAAGLTERARPASGGTPPNNAWPPASSEPAGQSAVAL